MRLSHGRASQLLIVIAGTFASVATAFASELSVLDSNRDGIIDPYEALDALLVLQQEHQGSLTVADILRLAGELRREEEESAAEFLSELDQDGDGVVELGELDEELRAFAGGMDADGDGVVSPAELVDEPIENILSSEDEIQERLVEIFAEHDQNKDGRISLSTELAPGEGTRVREWDGDRDGVVTREEAYVYMKADNTPVKFDVQGETAYMTGVITSELPAAVLQLIVENPQVNTIEMLIVPGSIDDISNLRAAMYVHDFGLTTKLNSRSAVASGGTDFFLAGVERVVEPGATLGVHSWGGFGMDGADVPEDDSEHQKYIDYYIAVDVPPEFYWYTMHAAPADAMHFMTEEEIEQYNVRTVPVKSN